MPGVPSRGRPDVLRPFLAPRRKPRGNGGPGNVTGRRVPRVSIEDVVSLRNVGPPAEKAGRLAA